MEIGNAEAIVRTVAAGYGIAFVSNLASACPLERGNVIDLEVDGLQLKRTIFMARKAGSSPHRPRDAFWGFIHAPENADLIRLPEQ
jgi:DNA-binding transcriptional LysR family regulator